MAFIFTVTLAALALIALGALGALALRLRADLAAARDEIEALKARLAAPTVWAGLGAEWSEAQALTADIISRPLAATALPAPDFAAPNAWLVDPPEPGAPSPAPVQPAAPASRGAALRRGRSVRRSLTGDSLETGLFPAWTADAALLGVEKVVGSGGPAPGAAVGVALFGVYAMSIAVGGLFGWPWAATLAVLLVLAGMMAAGFWRSERSLGLSAACVMAGAAPWAAALTGAPVSLMAPAAAGVCALAALVSLGRRDAALTWTAAGLVPLAAAAVTGLSALGRLDPVAVAPMALSLATLACLGQAKAVTAADASTRRPASALLAVALACLAAGTLVFGPAGAFGVGLAAAVAFAIALALGPARDFALVAAWLAACVGLYALSGDALATAAMTPAAMLAGAAFFGAGLSRTPRPQAHGLVPFSLAAAAPLGAIALTLSGGEAALAYAGLAALLALSFAAAAEARGGPDQVTLAAWPLALGAAAAASLALSAVAPAALVGPVGALAAMMAALLAARTGAGPLAASACALAAFAAFAAVDAAWTRPSALSVWIGAAVTALSLLAGAWLASSRRLSGAPATGVILAAAGLLVAVGAPLVLFPDVAFHLRGAGALAAAWLVTGLLMQVFGDEGGGARRIGLLLAGSGAALAAFALVGVANPWWSPAAAPLPAGAAALALALGAAAPALLTGFNAALCAVRGERFAAGAFGFLTIGLVLVGAALALRTVAFGPASLKEPGFSALELTGLTVVMAALGAGLLAMRDARARRAGLVLTGAALAKFALLDLHASGLAPAMASVVVGLALLAGVIAAWEPLRRIWRAEGAPSSPTTPKPASP